MSKNALPYYKAYPRDFIEGTLGMSFEEKGAYRIILDLIYMKGGALSDDDRYIAGVLGLSVRKWNSLKNRLVELGKIQLIDGLLSNYRAVIELETLSKYQDKQAENRSKPNKNNNLQRPPFDQPEPEPEPILNTTYLAEKVDQVSGEEDFTSAIFSRGVQFLIGRGNSEIKSRSIIGRWRKTYSDEKIFEAFKSASDERAVEPIAFITKVLKAEGKKNEAVTYDLQGKAHRASDVTPAGELEQLRKTLKIWKDENRDTTEIESMIHEMEAA